ncbi:11-beta-hydroxysteroid dehydrogenase-like 6 [Quercus suber]|uniref:11-beta-hydroxysteroid dehydrogenase-like 6 n=1 Tax=Quercus suber TaxID=58331 RepID=A0AAW0KP80_QUESU
MKWTVRGCAKAIVNSACKGERYLTKSAWFKVAYFWKDINFWGSVYSTHYAVPHLRKSKGKIVVISSVAAWFCTPRLSFYNASKAAQICFFESLRAEFGPDIGITIVTPGVIESEMTQDQFLRKIEMPWLPVESTERCAKAIVDSTCKGDMYLTKPSWVRVGFWMRVLYPEVFEWCLHSIKAMDLLHKFLNIAVPLLMLIAFPFFMPPFLLLKFLSFLKRSIYSEKVSGKVVHITRVSSEIGKHVAYEYARRGAHLALVDIRDDRLLIVADKAQELGSPKVIVVRADVSKVEEFKQMSFYNVSDMIYGPNNFLLQMDSYTLSPQASSAAIVSFLETLRVEVGPEIKITIVTPSFIESEMTQDKLLLKEGKMEVDQDSRLERCKLLALLVIPLSPCHIISIPFESSKNVLKTQELFRPPQLKLQLDRFYTNLLQSAE